MDFFRKKNYKVVSASAAAVEHIAKPVEEKSHNLALEGSNQVYGGFLSMLDQAERGSNGKFTWVSVT